MTAQSQDDRQRVHVFGPHGSSEGWLRECYNYRTVVRFLARRDLIIRYRHTAIGIGWVICKPVLAMAIFTIVFGRIAHMPAHGVPYPVLVLTGMIPWQFFSSVVNDCSISLANNLNLVTKVWLPRILLPSSTVILNLTDAMINVLLLLCLLAWYHVAPSVHMLLLPLVFLPVVLISLGCGLFCSTMMVLFQDVKNIIPVALQFGLLASPVAYTLAGAPNAWSQLLWLNPLAPCIEWVRWSVLNGMAAPSLERSLIALTEGVLIFLFGVWFFRNQDARLADAL